VAGRCRSRRCRARTGSPARSSSPGAGTSSPSWPAEGNRACRRERSVGTRALGVTGEPVVGDGLPPRRVGDELAHARADAWVRVEPAQADAHAAGILGMAAEYRRAALAAEILLEAALRPPGAQLRFSLDDPERPRRGAR